VGDVEKIRPTAPNSFRSNDKNTYIYRVVFTYPKIFSIMNFKDACILILVLTLTACGGKSGETTGTSEAGSETDAELLAWLNESRANKLEPQSLKIHPRRYQTLSIGHGIFVHIPPGAIIDPHGLTPNVEVDLRVRSIMTMDDFVHYGIPTEPGDGLASFAGAYYFDVRDTTGNALEIDPALGVVVAFPVPKNSPLAGEQKKNLLLYKGKTTGENKRDWEPATDFKAEPKYLKKFEKCRALINGFVASKTRKTHPFRFNSEDELTSYTFAGANAAHAAQDTFSFFQAGEKYFWNKAFDEGAAGVSLKFMDGEAKYYDVTDACKPCAIAIKSIEADNPLKKMVAEAKNAEYEYVHMRITGTGWYAVGRPYGGETKPVEGKVLKPNGEPANFARVHWISPSLRMHIERDVTDGNYKIDAPAGGPYFLLAERGNRAMALAEGNAGQPVSELKLTVLSEADRNRMLQKLAGR
jgi:hypothetical protein